MSTSYDGSLLDHLAEYMIYLSTAPSFWYSLNSSYDHGFHLSRRLGMTPHVCLHRRVPPHGIRPCQYSQTMGFLFHHR
jgi:hypothetical protein